MFERGVELKTHHAPHGTTIYATVVPLLGDQVAIRKSSGFASHSADYFCSLCKLRHAHLGEIDRAKWEPRTGRRSSKRARRTSTPTRRTPNKRRSRTPVSGRRASTASATATRSGHIVIVIRVMHN